MTPEEKARRDIDRQLEQCGWLVQDRSEMHISAGPGVAAREFPIIIGEANYLLYANSKAIGVFEADPQGHTLAGVEGQSVKYAGAPPIDFRASLLRLPFCYETIRPLSTISPCSNLTP
jgi:type I restriction enzyme R subunit